jgi:hypothetical protein
MEEKILNKDDKSFVYYFWEDFAKSQVSEMGQYVSGLEGSEFGLENR